MVFAIDVRKNICEPYVLWHEFIDVRSEVKILYDDEEDKEVKDKLDKVLNLLDEILEKKKNELHNKVHEFEKGFVQDVLKNPDWYKTE